MLWSCDCNANQQYPIRLQWSGIIVGHLLKFHFVDVLPLRRPQWSYQSDHINVASENMLIVTTIRTLPQGKQECIREI